MDREEIAWVQLQIRFNCSGLASAKPNYALLILCVEIQIWKKICNFLLNRNGYKCSNHTT